MGAQADARTKDARTKMMIDKLYDQMARGCINNDWAEEFISSVKNQFDAGLTLSPKQLAKLEELFERF